ncbi:hypothetical protein F5Y17DRAFT_414289 [Xylariaceae sp. FL0594]|nr:hypothetical protein F5Y17DRAFT_414289 [Xylariaceae sp. FL0594]
MPRSFAAAATSSLLPSSSSSWSSWSGVSSMARPTLADLEQAALSVVQLMKAVPGLANVRLALIGELAISKYLVQQSRPCESIEFLVKSASPSLVKKVLIAHGPDFLFERSQAIFCQHPAGWMVEIKITPEWLCPYLPSSARFVAEIDELPYISLMDLFVFTADACGLHESDASKQREARDAAALLALASEHFPLELEDEKLHRVAEALDTLVEHSPPENNRRWWERRVGMQSDKRRSAQDILSELDEGLRLDEEEGRRAAAAARRPSVFSLTRGSSQRSTSSLSSASGPTQPTTPISSPPPLPPHKMRPRKMSVNGSYPRPRRHTQTSMGPPPPEYYAPAPVQEMSHHDLYAHRLHADLMDTRGRASPGIAFINRP